MNAENTQAQMRKGILEYCILSILKQNEAYPSDIISQMKDLDILVVEGTLYPLLTRLKNADILKYRWEESTTGPPRKYYSITESGLMLHAELSTTWNTLRNAIDTLNPKI